MNMKFQSLKQIKQNYRRQKFIFTQQPKMTKTVKHNNNNKNRFLCSSLIIFIFLLANGITKINAVPTDSTGAQTRPLLLQRALRDVAAMMTARLVQQEDLTKDTVATSTETLLDQPQGQCLRDGVLVAETSVECEQKAGCRAIQKTGHCCPDFKCDCEKDGKTYLNGDKLVDPETPCTVCYCKGGEILCSSAVCFHRDDCTPRYIPNRCCPEYDNCPVTNKTMVSSTIAPKPEVPSAAALNLNITIKEITKPTEIRITDENKAKPIHQMLKTSTTTTTTTTTTTEAPQSSSSIGTDEPNFSSTTATVLMLIKDPENHPFTDGTSGSINKNQEAVAVFPPSAIDNHESANSQELKNIDQVLGNGSSKINIKREFMYVSTDGPIKPNFNETNGELSSAELLNWSAETSGTNSSLLLTETDLDPDTAGSDNIYHIILSTDGPGENFAASSTIEQIVPKISSTTEDISSSSTATPIITAGIGNIESSTIGIKNKTDPVTEAPKPKQKTTSTIITTTTAASITESVRKSSTHHPEEEDTALPLESNPAYPSLPEDDFSIRDTNLPLSEVDDTAETDLKDQSRSYADHLAAAAAKAKEDAGMVVESGSGAGSDVNIVMLMKDIPNVSEDVKMPSSTLSPATTAKVQLMNSMEEASSAETTITNGTEFQMDKLMHELGENETGSGDSLEMLSPLESIIDGDFGSGSGNGSEELQAAPLKSMKEREPTTPRPKPKVTTELDLDELGNASGDGKSEPLDDPKLDAESLKADEKESEGVAQAQDSKAPKSDIISVKLNPKQEKTLEEQEQQRFSPSPVELSV